MNNREFLLTKALVSVAGPTDPDEVLALAEAAGSVPKDGVIVDIGLHEGRTAIALALGSDPSVAVYGIDIERFPKYLSNVEKFELQDRLFRIIKKSHLCAKTWTLPINMIFIDGDHSYEAVRKDIKGWMPHVVKGGVVAFHDYVQRDVKDAVDKFEGKLYTHTHTVSSVYFAKRL